MNDQKPPLVSVIIPCYNHGRFVAEAIGSVLGQSHSPVEIIVVDDGSTDDSAQVIATFGDRVRLLRQENLGPSAARNTGFLASQGEFITFLDADDLYEADFITRLLSVFDRDPACLAAYCQDRFIREDGQPLPVAGHFVIPRPEEMHAALLLEFHIPPACILARRICYEKEAGLFEPQLRYHEDWEMALRIARTGKLAGIPDVLMHRRIVSGSLSRRTAPAQRHEARLALLQKHIGMDDAEPGRLTPHQRHAYGHAYLTAAAEYLGQKDRTRAHRYLQRAFALAPDLIHRVSSYLMLCLPEQQSGEESPELPNTPSSLAQFLEGVFDDPDTPTTVRECRNEALAHLDVILGLISYQSGDPLAACHFFLGALTRYPQYTFIREPVLPPYPSDWDIGLFQQLKARHQDLFPEMP
uniref:Glycosyltransferase involved in cell wall bisynthesis n=1 Tax=Candidatus Kentrum sp. FW TaxID=2126338 RepID=A0A450TYS3_9GAMM|nr:MAG: Glycosyltransferase involved in cell wall bisynthesis [Candidatus Kentron sp. FW]